MSQHTHLTMPVSERDHRQGPESATVTLVQYGDYECPYTRQSTWVVQAIQQQLGDQLRFVFRNFPLIEIHPHALHAAFAAEAAAAQGKFWQMHDAMYADQSKLDEASLVKTAAGLGMDQNSFESCLKSSKYKTDVEHDVQAASEAGVNATPTFFINGEFLSGVQSDADFGKIIDRQLATLGGKVSTQAASR